MACLRRIEMYVGVYQGNSKTWYETFVEIPVDTSDEDLHGVAEDLLWRELEADGDATNVAFLGVLHIPEPDDRESGPDWDPV